MIPVSPIPGTFFEWDDQSAISNAQEIVTTTPSPLYCVVTTADKGKENWQVLSGQDWFDMYAVNNVIDFSRHGQPLLQTAMAVNAGAKVLCKRVCADDACLANLAVIATLKTSEVQKTDSQGNLLYTDASTGKETTLADGNTPIMVNNTSISYSYKSAAGCETKQEVIEAINSDIASGDAEEGTSVYPLWIIFENGRGESKKRIKITPNYQLSKNYDSYFLYDLDVFEGNKYFPTMHFALSPNLISGNANMSFKYVVNTSSSQIEAYQYDDNILEFMDAVMAATGMDLDVASGMDLLFGKNKKAKAISGISVDTDTGVDLTISTGQLLLNGDNGSFGDKPIESENYGPQLAKALAGYIVSGDGNNDPTILTFKDGCYDPIIYNVDRYKIDAVLDANYPDIVKRAAEQLVSFREDCMFFRDMGTACNTMDLIIAKDESNLHNKFCTTYCTYYDVIDPFSKKQITVTIMYHMAQLMVEQFNNGRNLPMAGIKYGFTIDDAIEGTIGFTPTICPDLDEKQDLIDARINYATYIDDRLVVESIYTSQDKYTQLSFSNNILAVQQIIKVIRAACPAIRYSFIDGADLEKYKADVERFIEPYKSNFDYLSIEYVNDPYYTANKIFYASLAVRFRDFVQTEYFKITALSSESEV